MVSGIPPSLIYINIWGGGVRGWVYFRKVKYIIESKKDSKKQILCKKDRK
ncbi:hypothetical protein DCO58_06155 [Helicobacter saguini]|nr:hypothetical protein [Helicobacter saguini]MWV67250.1 hypothetical protein [Helicobacter saguini]MWV70847.1 hypothetical protein [Helicobacter saguini]